LNYRLVFHQTSEIALSDQLFLLERLLQENNAFEEVSFINLDGKETARQLQSGNSNVLQDISQLPKFTSPVEGGTYIGDVYHTLSGPFVTLSAPVHNRGGIIIQILSAEVNLGEVVRSIEAASLGTTGYVALFDTNGVLIVHGGFKEVQRGTDFSAFSRVERVLSGVRLDGLGKLDRYESLLGAGAVVGAGQRVGTSGWALLAEWPLSDADAVIDEVRMQIIQFTIFSIFAVLLLAPLFAHRLTEPIRLLEAGAKDIREGHFEKRVSIETGDELQELGEEFNRMAKGLKRLQELKDEFVFVAAHELKAPVTVIKGYISMIIEGDAGPLSREMKDFLAQINKANQNLVKLVQDLLQVARSEAGRIEIVGKPTSVTLSTQELLGEFKPVADEKSIVLQYEPPGDVPLVLADPDKLKEVLSNLVSNAIKYTPDGGIVTVTHEIEDTTVVTHVKDTGIGMSMEAQKKLFQKFYRIKTAYTEEVSGTGLGLWIIKQLIEKMNGTIRVVSEEGKGSTFSFSLPQSRKDT